MLISAMFLCRSVDELPSPNSDSEVGEGEKKQKSKIPRRKFPWTDETRYKITMNSQNLL